MNKEYLEENDFNITYRGYVVLGGWIISNNNFCDEIFIDGDATILENKYHTILKVIFDEDIVENINTIYFHIVGEDEKLEMHIINSCIIPAKDVWLGSNGYIEFDRVDISYTEEEE